MSKQILVMKIWSYKASCIIRIESMPLKCHVPEITSSAMNDSRQVFQSCCVTDTLAVVSLKKSSVLSWYHVHFIRAILGASQFISQQHNLEHSQLKGVFKLSTCFHALLKSEFRYSLAIKYTGKKTSCWELSKLTMEIKAITLTENLSVSCPYPKIHNPMWENLQLIDCIRIINDW